MKERAAAMKQLIAISFSIKPNDSEKKTRLVSFVEPSAARKTRVKTREREKIEPFFEAITKMLILTRRSLHKDAS